MSKLQWVRYSSENVDIVNAVKIVVEERATVLLARSKVEDDNNGSAWCFGDFNLAEKYATVCSTGRAFAVKDFEVSNYDEVFI